MARVITLTRKRKAGSVVTSWTWRTGSLSGDVNRVTRIQFQGTNGSWTTIDDWTGISGLSTNTTYTRTGGVDFSNSTSYLDYRWIFTLSQNANTFVAELQALAGAIDLTDGCSPTDSVSGASGDPAKAFDNNTGTYWPDAADVSSGVTLEANIV